MTAVAAEEAATPSSPHREHVAACRRAPALFRPWELRFLDAMDRRANPTKRQRSLVTSMLARVAHQREAGR